MALLKVIQNVLGRKQEVYVPTQKQVEIDFGSVAVEEKVFIITDADVQSGMKITATHSADAATDKEQDENEMDKLVIAATANNGSITMYVSAIPNCVSGAFKINYIVS